MPGVILVASNLMLLVACICLADAFLPAYGRDSLKRPLAILAGHSVLAVTILLALGSAGLLVIGPVTLATAAVMLVAMVIRHLCAAMALPAVNHAPILADERQPAAAVIFTFGGFAALALASGILLGTRFAWDDLSYHAPAVAQWCLDRRISLAPFSYQAYYPFNCELYSTWFFLPIGADAYVSMAGIYWLALLVLAAMALLREWRCSWQACFLAGLLLLCSNVVSASAMTFAATDLAGPALLLASICFLLPRDAVVEQRRLVGEVTLAGLLAGLAVGSKVSFAPAALVLFAYLALRTRRELRAIRRRVLAAFIIGLLVTGSYWYIRNAWLTGNPLFPAALGPLAGPFHRLAQHRTQLWSWILDFRRGGMQWWLVLGGYFWWPLGAWLISVAGLVMAVRRRVAARRETGGDTLRSAESLLLLLAMVMLVLFPIMPFSGTADAPIAVLRPYPRYIIAPFAIGIVLFCLRMDALPGRAKRFWWGVAIFAVLTCRVVPLRDCYYVPRTLGWHWLISLGMIVVGGAAALALSRSAMTSMWRRHVYVFAASVAAIAVMLWTPGKQALTNHNLHAYGLPGKPVGAGWRAVEKIPSGSKVAWYGPAAYQYYALFGRHMQVRPACAEKDGSPYVLLHDLWRERPDLASWWSQWNRPMPQLTGLVHSLRNSGIEYVFLTQWDGDYWAAQADALRRSPEVTVVYDDGYSAIVRLGGLAPTAAVTPARPQ